MNNTRLKAVQVNDELFQKVTKCVEAHKEAYEQWPHGKVLAYFDQDNGDIHIHYQSDAWWHYRITDSGEVQWW